MTSINFGMLGECYTIVKEEAVVIPDAGVRDLGYTVLPWLPIYESHESASAAANLLHEAGFPIGWVVIRMDQLFDSLASK